MPAAHLLMQLATSLQRDHKPYFTKALSRGCIGILCKFRVDVPRDCLAEPFLGPAAAYMVHRHGEISLVELVL
jgi:hypothetical protein